MIFSRQVGETIFIKDIKKWKFSRDFHETTIIAISSFPLQIAYFDKVHHSTGMSVNGWLYIY